MANDLKLKGIYDKLSQWNVLMSVNKSQPPITAIFQTSFTDRMPMQGWKLEHAIREIWQNFLDGIRNSFQISSPEEFEWCGKNEGNVLEINSRLLREYEHRLPPTNLVYGPYTVGRVDLSNPHCISIYQAHTILNLECLHLYSSKGEESGNIGGHGEGFKVAINLLLRHGYKVTYAMPNSKWTFSFENCMGMNCKNMVINITPNRDAISEHALLITVEGPNAISLFNYKMDINLMTLNGKYEDRGIGIKLKYKCQYGSFYTALDPTDYGRVYCRGLFVAICEDLKNLKLVADLNTHIARDRHLLPPDYMKFVGSIIQHAAKDSSEHKIQATQVLGDILEICKSLDTTALKTAPYYIRGPLKLFLSLENKISVNDVLFYGSIDPRQSQKLKDMGKLIYFSKALALDEANINQLTTEFVLRAPNVAHEFLTLDEKKYLSAFEKYAISIFINSDIGDSIDPNIYVKQLPDSVADDYYPIFPLKNEGAFKVENFIILSRSHLTSSMIFVATNLFQIILKLLYGDKVSMAMLTNIQREFFLDPLGFKICHKMPNSNQTNEPPSLLKANLNQMPKHSDTDSNSNHSQQNIPGRKETPTPTNISPQKPSAPTPKPKHVVRESLVSPEDKIRNSEFNGIKRTASNFQPDEEGTNVHCKFIGTLCDRIITDSNNKEHIIYVDNSCISAFGFDVKIISGRMSDLDKIVKGMARCIKSKLKLKELVMAYVYADNSLLGFNRDGDACVYLNIQPLLSLSGSAMLSSIYFTILHEITHRAITGHDSSFADQYGKLVLETWECHCT